MAAKRSVDALARAPSAAKRSKWAEASSPHAAASEVARRLSAFVKEKMTREQLEAAAVAANAAQAPLIGPGGIVDAETAKARALAQASLLALKLPTTQVAPSDLAKRLYIGNLYYDLKEEDVRNWFAPFGAIHSIDLSLEPGASRSKGFCFLEYEDVLAAESAVQVLNGTQLSNRTLRVGRPHRGSSHPGDTNAGIRLGQEAIKNVPTKCIYVANVRSELTSVHLESIFSPFGQVRACVMTAVSPLETKMHRGYGFLEFSEEAFAQSAIQHMNGFELAGQPLKVGKASSAAMLINLAISTDKIVRDGEEATLSALQHPKSTASFDEDDVEAVKDVDAEEKRCLCLLNLVKCGEVDKELEGEVHIECSKYGSVRRVLVHELPDHVRIFVEFAAASAAEVARKSLSGRFFGGNQVDARFYSLQELEHQRYTSAFL